jgi:hypothetical protein
MPTAILLLRRVIVRTILLSLMVAPALAQRLVPVDAVDLSGLSAASGLLGRGNGPEILTSASSLPFALICESSRDSTIEIYNSGNADLHVTDATITGTDAGDFTLSWKSGTPPFTIVSGDHVKATVSFEPKTMGAKSADLVLTSNALNGNAGTLSLPLSGQKDSAGFVLSQPGVYFDDIPINAPATASLTLTNTGTLPLAWSPPMTAGSFVVESITPPVTSPNGGSSQVVVRFLGGNEGWTLKDTVVFRDPYCGSIRKLGLTARVHADPSAEIAIPEVSGAPGDTIEVPIEFRNDRFIAWSGVTGYRTTLRFNASLLVPLGYTVQGTIVGNDRIIPLDLPPEPSCVGVFMNMRFIVALGNDTATDILLENTSAVGGNVALTIRSGRFTLNGVCREGGIRLFNNNGTIVLKPARPNPVNDRSEIEYEVIESGRTRLYITDMLGRRVATLVDGEVVPGRYVAQLDASRIPSGTFYCVLQTPTERRVQSMIVTK